MWKPDHMIAFKTDIFSYGMVLGQIFCGRCQQMSMSTSKNDIFNKIGQMLRGDTPMIILELIENCIQYDPDNRPICFQVDFLILLI